MEPGVTVVLKLSAASCKAVAREGNVCWTAVGFVRFQLLMQSVNRLQGPTPVRREVTLSSEAIG